MIETCFIISIIILTLSLFDNQFLSMSHDSYIHHVKSIFIKSLRIWTNINVKIWDLHLAVDTAESSLMVNESLIVVVVLVWVIVQLVDVG